MTENYSNKKTLFTSFICEYMWGNFETVQTPILISITLSVFWLIASRILLGKAQIFMAIFYGLAFGLAMVLVNWRWGNK